MENTLHWILTFDRPMALNRLINALGHQGIKSNVFSNHPKLQILNENKPFVEEVVVNSLNSTHSNAWCARSWNSIMIRSWHRAQRLVMFQDDTCIDAGYSAWMDEATQKYDFMWGPGGDQWHTLTYDVFKNTGYWDERYIGCYCGDADYLRRVWFNNNPDRIAIHEEHQWGLMHNPDEIRRHILTEMSVKTVDPNYQNQHWQLEEGGTNPTIKHSQKWFQRKWGYDLDSGGPVNQVASKTSGYGRLENEIDWYPWFTKFHNVEVNGVIENGK